MGQPAGRRQKCSRNGDYTMREMSPESEADSEGFPVPTHGRNRKQSIVTDPTELLSELRLTEEQVGWSREAARSFQFRIPRSFLRRMRIGDPDDPLLRQVLPTEAEMRSEPGFAEDAVGDLDSAAGAGILHKYHGRGLLVTTGACAVKCRYCFRRHFPYSEQSASRNDWEVALEYLRKNHTLHEIILSGGDPLTLSERR